MCPFSRVMSSSHFYLCGPDPCPGTCPPLGLSHWGHSRQDGVQLWRCVWFPFWPCHFLAMHSAQVTYFFCASVFCGIPAYPVPLGCGKHVKLTRKKCSIREFPGGPVVRTLYSHCQGPGFSFWRIRELGTPQALQHSQTDKKQKAWLAPCPGQSRRSMSGGYDYY